jgi:hypothetical protein
MRTTFHDIEVKVKHLNELSAGEYAIDGSYGRYKLVRKVRPGSGVTDVSYNVPIGQLNDALKLLLTYLYEESAVKQQ